uniref:Uncharacterized protein n=1 Tax=Anguilla anguilla TaxID=7936 RepID=A0A0E9XA54_ANGAN
MSSAVFTTLLGKCGDRLTSSLPLSLLLSLPSFR